MGHLSGSFRLLQLLSSGEILSVWIHISLVHDDTEGRGLDFSSFIGKDDAFKAKVWNIGNQCPRRMYDAK
ncbi:hypothetical protein Pfo_010332 [Paulownia fortunei]|nr:hypothetical protein Pfo_010332 [Paulownia fortunei]